MSLPDHRTAKCQPVTNTRATNRGRTIDWTRAFMPGTLPKKTNRQKKRLSDG
jgi:hypothetical protein